MNSILRSAVCDDFDRWNKGGINKVAFVLLRICSVLFNLDIQEMIELICPDAISLYSYVSTSYFTRKSYIA